MGKKTVWSKRNYLCVALCFLASMAIFGLAKGAPIPTQASGPRYGGTLRLSDIYDGVSIGYPPKMTKTYHFRQAAPAVETLFRIDNTGKPVPWLATGAKNNVAANMIALTLRKGVKFHDGTDFNAEAVKWNLEQCMSVKSGGTEKFKSIDMIDDYTVRINLTEWDSRVISNLAQILGMIISPTAYKKNGEEWCANHPVGTGPFQFISWEKDVRTTYKKFEGYWQKGKPYLDRIECTPIIDPITREFSLKRGELDLMLTMSSKGLAGLEKDGYVILRRAAGSGSMGLVPDSANPKSPFADVRVRQAAQYAIDTGAIVKAIFFGEAEAANQYSYKGYWGYNPSVVGYPYNPTKARQLLAEAGYPNGFKTKILFLTSPDNDQLCTAVQGYLKAIGIDAELDLMQTARVNNIVYGDKWEGLLYGIMSSNPDVLVPLTQLYSGGSRNYTQMLVPDDYAKAIQKAIAAPDFETKQKYTQEVMKLMVDKYCLRIELYCASVFGAHQKYLHNHGFYGTPDTSLWTPEDAWLEH